MHAKEIREYFLSRSPRVNPETTVDTFKFGDPETEIKSVGVTWMLTMDAIDEAERLGVNVIVTHEPTFYTHTDDVSQVADDPAYLAKVKRLEEAGLTVMRLHDCWDGYPEIGIGDSLVKLLELTRVDADKEGPKVYAPTAPTTLGAFATFVRTKLGMDGVLVMGDDDRAVARVGLCFGMSGGLVRLRGYCAAKVDCIVAGEMINWQDVRYLQDNRMPLILSDHAASENPGMRSMADFLASEFGLEAHYIETGPALRTVTG